MWYVLQAGIAIGAATFWCTLPGHSPNEFGHGLFLGGILAWYATVLIDALREPSRLKRATRVTAGGQSQLGSSAVPLKGVKALHGPQK